MRGIKCSEKGACGRLTMTGAGGAGLSMRFRLVERKMPACFLHTCLMSDCPVLTGLIERNKMLL